MRVLAVGAHPDDLEILCAGTLAKYAQRGDHISMAVATNGEVGSATLSQKEIANIRHGEAAAAAKVIPVSFLLPVGIAVAFSVTHLLPGYPGFSGGFSRLGAPRGGPGQPGTSGKT